MSPAARTDVLALRFALFSATAMIAQQVAGKATRDALFLSHFEVTELPKVVIAAAVLSLLAVFGTARLIAGHGPTRLVPAAFAASAALFAAEWWIAGRAPGVAAVAVYLHVAVFGAVLVSGFWSVVNERFDPHSARRRVARIAAAATLGGVLGGLVAAQASAVVDLRSMLLVLAAMHALCALGVRGVGAPARPAAAPARPERVRSGLHVIASSRYLQLMTALAALVALIAALLDYALKAEAAARFESSEALIAFFANFYALVGLATFALQSTLGRRLLQRHGIAATIAVLPAAVAAGALLGAGFARLATAALARGLHSVLANSLYRSGFELLYTPLPPDRKRPTKALVDVGAERVGDMLGAGLILVLLAVLAELPTAAVLALAAVASAAALAVVSRLHRGYVDQLARSLRAGALRLDAGEVVDATTQQILTETSVHSERQALMARIKALKERRGAGAALEDTLPGTSAGAAPPHEADRHRLVRAIGELGSGDADRVRAALIDDFMDVRLVAHLVPLLGDDRVAEDAAMELKWQVPRIIGQLTDALLDPDLALLARTRLPAVLEVCHNPRVVDALLAGLRDEPFEVRRACARALARMRARAPALAIPPEAVYAAVRGEVAVDRETWAARGAASRDGALDPSAEHCFTVLGLVLDHGALQLALHAVLGGDQTIRGTALEYLENVLPEDIRRRLWLHLGVGPRPALAARSADDLADALRRRGGRRPGG